MKKCNDIIKKENYFPERVFFQRVTNCNAFIGVILSGSTERISSNIISSSLKRPGAVTFFSILLADSIQTAGFPSFK